MEAADNSRRRLPEETRRRIAAKLVCGRDSTVRLQFLLRSPTTTEQDKRALAAEILSSFTEAISALDSFESAGDELSCPDHSLCSDLDSSDSRRSPAVTDSGRGNKRRRGANSRIVKSSTTEDEYAWRKYGQKVILNTTHPRSYFRCTHKYDQGCGATKHVQKMEGDSQMYKITYISNHTCRSASPIASAVADFAAASDDSYNVCFSESRKDQLSESTGRFFWPSSDDDATKAGESTSGVTNEMDLWSEWKDFGSLQETTVTNNYCFSTGDDADSNRMFWDGLLQ